MSRNPGPDQPPPGAPISFKTVPGRHRTQKWNKAANYSYDGDDWGGYDPYDEYGYGDEQQQQQQASPQIPAQASQLSSQRTRQRSFDRGDDGARSVSAPFPSYDDRRGGPGLSSPLTGGRGSNDFPRSSSRPRDFTNPETAPPPPMSHDAPAPSGWFPPRRSSLKGDTYETQQQAAEAKAIAESVTNPATNIGAVDTEKSLPFIRPSDIYKRMEEQKRRESEEGPRPSVDSLPRGVSDLTPVQERRESQLFPDHEDQKLENSTIAVDARDAVTKDTSPTLPLLSRFSGFGDDFLTQSVLSKSDDLSSSLQSKPSLNTAGLSEAQTTDSSLQQTPVVTRAPPGQDPAAEILAERQQETDSLQHQPSVGLRSVVHKAFDTGDASLSRDNSESKPGSTGIGRSDTSATGSISPIMSRVPPTGIAALGPEPGSGQVPPIVEEASREHNPAMFEPGYRRSLDPPSTGTSPARTPNLETTKGKRLSTPMSAVVGDGETPYVRDQGAEVVEPIRHSAATPVGGLPPIETKSLPPTGRGRSDTDYSVRESDIADTINASPDKDPISPELAEASKDSRDLFLATHNLPAPSSPATPGGTARVATPRTDSPTKGRVREIANRYHEMHDASRRNSGASIGSSKSSWSRFGDDEHKQRSGRIEMDTSQLGQASGSSVDGLSAPRPELDREVSFKPDLPGGWINSSAPTPAVEEPPAAEPAEPVLHDQGPPTPIDLTPTTKKFQLRESEPGNNITRSPVDGAKDIGNQLAASVVSSYGGGHQTRDFGSAEPTAPVDQPEMLPKRAYGDVSVAPPLLRHETENSSDTPTSVASSIAPTPISKDTPEPRSGLSSANAGYFNTVAPLRVRSREPSPEHAGPALTAPEARQQHLGHNFSDNGADDEESDRLRREIVASLEDDTARTQDALDTPDNARKIEQGDQPLPAAEAGAVGLGAAAAALAAGAAASSSTTTSVPPKPGLLTTRFSWEAPPVTAEKALPQSPGIKPEAAYERQRSSKLHVMNPEAGELSPDTPIKPRPDASRMSTNGPLAVPDLSRPEAAAAEEGIVRSLSQRVRGLGVNVPKSPINKTEENTIPETTARTGSPTGSLREMEHSTVTNLAPEKDWTKSSSMHTATSPNRPKSAGKIPPFRTILNMKTPEERIKAYTETRQTFADMNTGLSDWLAAMSSKQPDVFDAAESDKPLPSQPVPGMAGPHSWKRNHRPAPSIAGFKNRFASGGSATADSQGRSASIGSAGGPALDASDTARPATGSQASGGIDMDRVQQQMQARGKEFMKNSKVLGGKASAGAKGLLAKGRSRFGGGGGSVRGKGAEVSSSPPPSSSSFGSKFHKKRSAPGPAIDPSVGSSAPADQAKVATEDERQGNIRGVSVSRTGISTTKTLSAVPDHTLPAAQESGLESHTPLDTIQAVAGQPAKGPTSIDPPEAVIKLAAEPQGLVSDDKPAPKHGDGHQADVEIGGFHNDKPQSAVATVVGSGVGASSGEVPVLDVKAGELERPQAPTPIEMLTEHDATALPKDIIAVHGDNAGLELGVSTATAIPDQGPTDSIRIITTLPSATVPVVPAPVAPSRRGSHAPSHSLHMPIDKRPDLSRNTSASSISAFLRRDGASTPSSSRSGSRPLSQVFERLREKGRSMSRGRMEGSRSRPASLILSQSNLLSDENLAEPKTAVLVADQDSAKAQHDFKDFDSSSAPGPFTTNSLSDVTVGPAWNSTSSPTTGLNAPTSPRRVEAWNAPDAQLPPKTPTGRSTERNSGRLGVLPSPAPTTMTFAEGERHASLEQSTWRTSAAAGRGDWRRGLEEKYGGDLEPVYANLGSEEEDERQGLRAEELGFTKDTAVTEQRLSEQTSDRSEKGSHSGAISSQQYRAAEEEDSSTAATAPSQRPQQQRKVSDISTLPSQQRRTSESQSPFSSRPASAVFSMAGSPRLGHHPEGGGSRPRPGSLAAILPAPSDDPEGDAMSASPEDIRNVAEDKDEEYNKAETTQPEALPEALPSPISQSTASASTLKSQGLGEEQQEMERPGSRPERRKPSTGAVNLASLIASATARRAKERDASSPTDVVRTTLIEAQPNPYVLSRVLPTRAAGTRHSSAELWEDARSEISFVEGPDDSLRRETAAGAVVSRGSSISSLGRAASHPALHADPARAPQMHTGDVTVAQYGEESGGPGHQQPLVHNRAASQPPNEGQQRSKSLLQASHLAMPDRPFSYILSPRDGDGLAQESITTGKDAPLSESPPVDMSLVSGPPIGTRPFQQHPVFRNSATSTGSAQPTDYERMRSTSRLSGVLTSPSLEGVDDPLKASRPQSGFFRGDAGTPSSSDVIPSRGTISDLHGLEDVHAWGVDTATTPHEGTAPGIWQRPDSKQGRRKSGIWKALSRRRSSTQALETCSPVALSPAAPPHLAGLESLEPSKMPAQAMDPLERTSSAKKKANTLQKPQRAKSNAVQIGGGDTQKKRFSGLKSLLGRSSTSAMPKNQAEDKNVKTKPEPVRKLKKMAPAATENVKPVASPPLYQGRPTNPATVLGSMSGYGEYEAARRRDMAKAAFGTPPPPQQPRYQAPLPSQPPADGWYGPSSARQEGEGAYRESEPTHQRHATPEFRRLRSGGSGQERAVAMVPEAFRPVESGFGQSMPPIGPPQGRYPPMQDLGPDLHSQRGISPPKSRNAGPLTGIQTSQIGNSSRVVSVGTEIARSPAKEYGDQQTPWPITLPQSEVRSQQDFYGAQYHQQQRRPQRPPPGPGPEPYQRRHSDVSRHSREQYYNPHPEDARLYNDRGAYPSPPFSPVSDLSPSPTQIRSPNWMSLRAFSQTASAGYSHPSQSPMYQAAGTGANINPQWYPRQQPPARRVSHQSQHNRPPPAGMRYYQNSQPPPSQQFGLLQSPYPRKYSGGQEPPAMGQRRPSSGYSGRRDDMTVGEEGAMMRGSSYPGQEWVPPHVQFEEERRWS